MPKKSQEVIVNYSTDDCCLSKLIFDGQSVELSENESRISKGLKRLLRLDLALDFLPIKISKLDATLETYTLDSNQVFTPGTKPHIKVSCPSYIVTGEFEDKQGLIKGVIRPGIMFYGNKALLFAPPQHQLRFHFYLEHQGKGYTGISTGYSLKNRTLDAKIFELEEKMDLNQIGPSFTAVELELVPVYQQAKVVFRK